MTAFHRPMFYRLNPDFSVSPIEGEDAVLEWAGNVETLPKLAYHEFPNLGQTVRVSTIFLGLDHNHGPGGPPVLFETMIFAPNIPSLDQTQHRYTTYQDAIAGHAQAVARVQEFLKGLQV
jgi:hypothetical protein